MPRFLCIPADSKGKVDTDDRTDPWSIVFELDPIERKMVETNFESKSALAKPVKNAFIREMTYEDWVLLRDGIIAVKREALAEMKAGKRNIHFPAEMIPHPEKRVGYYDLFPHEERITFDVGDECWLVDDQYCVNPPRPSTTVGLTMGSLSQETKKRKRRVSPA